MTKVRPPVTMENALRLALGRLEIEEAATITGRRPAYLQNCTDEAKAEQLTVKDLRLLDLAHRDRFGGGFPLFEALGRLLEADAAERFADHAAIGVATATVATEAGEAVAAMVLASQAGSGAPALENALRQLEEADASVDNAIPILRQALARERAALAHARDGPEPAPG